jgi:hypothetical protein
VAYPYFWLDLTLKLNLIPHFMMFVYGLIIARYKRIIPVTKDISCSVS